MCDIVLSDSYLLWDVDFLQRFLFLSQFLETCVHPLHYFVTSLFCFALRLLKLLFPFLPFFINFVFRRRRFWPCTFQAPADWDMSFRSCLVELSVAVWTWNKTGLILKGRFKLLLWWLREILHRHYRSVIILFLGIEWT